MTLQNSRMSVLIALKLLCPLVRPQVESLTVRRLISTKCRNVGLRRWIVQLCPRSRSFGDTRTSIDGDNQFLCAAAIPSKSKVTSR